MATMNAHEDEHQVASELHDTRSNHSDGVLEDYSEKPPPQKPKFYRQKRYWVVCSILTAVIVVVVVLLIVFVFFPMIAQALMNQSGIGVNEAQITFTPPNTMAKREQVNLNSTFFMSMASKLSNTGPFPADLKFHNPIEVYYNDTLLGTIVLPNGKISGGKGELNADTPFYIANTTYFAAFSRDMLAQETFKWTLKGKLDITALTRTATVDLNKEVSIPGMNGFPEVSIQSFQLPGDDPNGGILMELGCRLVSPSPISVQLGTIKLNVAYDGVDLGVVSATGVTLKQGDNDMLLKGTLKPQTDPTALEKVGVLFSNYVAGKMSLTTATGISAAPNGDDYITWLSEGFQSVSLNVQLGVEQPLDIIHSVNMGYIDLQFSKDAPYAPIISAPQVVAGFSVPFGFSLNIYEVQQAIEMSTEETGGFASIQVPFVPAQTNVQDGTLTFAMTENTIRGYDNKKPEFDQYTYALTSADLYSFTVGGEATTKTQTPLGNITLGGIKFQVPTGLHGLQFLNSTPTIIHGLDVTGGTPEYMQLSINVTMVNPADFSIATGDVYFNMMSQDALLGSVSLPALKLNRGANTVIAGANFDPKRSDIGQNLLSTFVMGQNNSVKIAGHDGSTEITSLTGALGAIAIETVLPGLSSALIQGSSLTVLDTSVSTGVVNVKVSIANPFTADLAITSVKSSVTYKGLPVGNINQDISASPFQVPGHSVAMSSPLDMNMNLEPAAVAFLLRDLAVQSALDTRPLDALLGMGGFQIEGQQAVDPTADLFSGFNISTFVMEAMKSLVVDLQLASGLNIGEYANVLQFAQSGVKTETDESITRLIPVVGQPIVQQIVDGSVLGFKTIVLSEPTNENYKVQIQGSITETGPMDATISFPEGLVINWQGQELGRVTMDVIHTVANVGAEFNVSGVFTIANQDVMGQFSAFMINTDEFTWEIYTQAVSVDALGFTFTGINMQKFVNLGGAKGFKDCVRITSFDLPANDPEGGIQLIAETVIQNPSQIGFALGGAAFESYFGDVLLGPLASNGPAVFPPLGSNNIQMKGRLIKQETPEGIAAITQVFDNYLNASDSILTIQGVSGSGPNGLVGWLTTGFKSIHIENVVLPGPEVKPELIPAITLKEMTLDFTKEAFKPMTSSKLVEAQLKSPFGFPLGVSSLSMDVTTSYKGSNSATLAVPNVPATTSATGLVSTQFSNVPFNVLDNAHDVFSSFVAALTENSNVTFGLAGAANSVATTAVGDLNLNNIGFNVQSSLQGFHNFDGVNHILEMAVTGGTPDYIEVTLKVQFNNPSQITIMVGDLSFDTIMNEKSTSVGTVYLKDVTIVPGPNTFDAVMHMMNPAHPDYVSQMVSIYMTNAQAPLTIAGTKDSTSVGSIQEALSTVRLATTMQGINSHLIEKAEVQARVAVIVTKKAKTWVTLNNPLKTPYTVTRVSVAIENPNNGDPYDMGSISYELPKPLVVPAGAQVRTDEWPVDIHANMFQLLGLLGKPSIPINLKQNVTVLVGDTKGGYATEFYYYQDAVTCELDIQLMGMSLPTLPETNKESGNSTVSEAVSAVEAAVATPSSSSSGQGESLLLPF